MYTVYHLHTNELGENFLRAIKTLFANQKIEIAISSEEDETEYLLKSKQNKKHLLKSIDDIDKGKGVTYTFNEFATKYEKKIADAKRNS